MGGGIGRGVKLCWVPTLLLVSDFSLKFMGLIVNASGSSDEKLQNMLKETWHEKCMYSLTGL